MTKEEYHRFLEEWRDFSHPDWQPFKAAWTARGFIRPPSGEPTDDAGTSQRSRLWAIADARPRDLGRWVREAPGRTTHEVIDYVFTRFGEVREDIGLGDEDWDEEKRASRKSAPELLREIMKRAG
jgi:hypothetical protein